MYLPRRPRLDQFAIFVYHRVAPITTNCAPPTFNVPPQLFRSQLEGLLEQGFKFLALSEVLRRRSNNQSLPPRTAVVTFDDGYECVYEEAWPILREFDIPATIFINTAFLGQQEPFPFDTWGLAHRNLVPAASYRPLTVNHCREMAASKKLIELGAHTHTHADFRGKAQLFQQDMTLCLQRLREEFELQQPTFAFPFGKPRFGFTEEPLVNLVRDFGLPCSLTTQASCAQLSESPFYWGRFNVYDWDTARTLTAKALGYYGWIARFFERFARVWPA
jgi:peptidoglycan/xylan/chitin deacetylase (PgdA/CDA1 family)